MNEQKQKQIHFFLKIGLIIILIIGLILLGKKLGFISNNNSGLNQALQWIETLNYWGLLIFILIYIFATIFLISGAVLTLGAGLIFGVVKGSILVSIASTLAATISFLIGRYLVRDWVSKQIENQPKFQAIDAAVAREGWKIVGLTRLSPLFPFVFLNYAFGVTKVSLKDYILASWIGMMPGTIMYVYLGSIGKTATEGNSVKLIVNIIGLIATILVSFYVTKIAKQAMEKII